VLGWVLNRFKTRFEKEVKERVHKITLERVHLAKTNKEVKRSEENFDPLVDVGAGVYRYSSSSSDQGDILDGA
jgi:hypothetical protein